MMSCQLSVSPDAVSELCSTFGYRGFLSPTAKDRCVPLDRLCLPARLHYAGNLACKRQLAEADPAKHKFSDVAARTTALLATVPVPDTEYRRFLLFCLSEFFVSRDLCSCRHYLSCSLYLPRFR